MNSDKTTITAPVHGIAITPGPWYFGKYADRVTATENSDGRDSICHVYATNQRDNATAIAAVPELLNLVACAYRALHRGQWEAGETDAELCKRINDTMCDHFGNDWCA